MNSHSLILKWLQNNNTNNDDDDDDDDESNLHFLK